MLFYLLFSTQGYEFDYGFQLYLHDSPGLVYLYGCLSSSYWSYIANEGIGLIPV